MKAHGHIIGRLMVGVALACCSSQNIFAQVTPPGGGTNSNTSGLIAPNFNPTIPAISPLWSGLLNVWLFDNSSLPTLEGNYYPRTYTNTSIVSGFDYGSLVVDSLDPEWLAYNIIENDGHTNMTLDAGTVQFWFEPDWSSSDTNYYGMGPGDLARLINVGTFTTNAIFGCWSLYLNPDGTRIIFSSQTNGYGTNYFSYPTSFGSYTWHMVTLTYSKTETVLYIDGSLATNGPEIQFLPSAAVVTNGFFVGSNPDGTEQAHGQFDDMRTYNYELTPTDVYYFYTNFAANSQIPNKYGYPTTATLLWSVHANDGYYQWGSPAMSPDGTLYVSRTGGSLWAFDTTTNPPFIKWTNSSPSNLLMGTTPAIGNKGEIYALTYSTSSNTPNQITAFRPSDGNPDWIFTFPITTNQGSSLLQGSPVVDKDETVYIGSCTNFYAITNGRVKWVLNYPNTNASVITNKSGNNYHNLFGFIFATAALGSDETLYIPTDLGQLFAVNSTNGSLKWVNGGHYTNDANPIDAHAYPPAIDSDGTILFAVGQYFMAMHPNGTYKWIYTNANTIFASSPVIGNDAIYFLTDSQLTAMSRSDGRIIWTNDLIFGLQTNPQYNAPTSIALASDGEIYTDFQPLYENYPSDIVSFAPDGSTNWMWSLNNPFGEGLVFSAPLIGPDGTVYFVTLDAGGVFAFAGPSRIACSPWPELQKNARRSAAVAMPAQVSAPVMTTNGFQFVVSGASNMVVCPCAGSDLMTWTNIGQIVLTNGSASFTDTNQTESKYPYRFFRAYAQ